MSFDLYEVLEIPDNANETWIRRAYDQKCKALAANTELTAEQRQKSQIALDKALNTLSNPEARERYDDRHIHGRVRAAGAGSGIKTRDGWFSIPGSAWALLALVLVIAVGLYWQNARETERLKIERERIAADRATKLREIALREAQQEDAVRLIDTALSQEDRERLARREERERLNQDSQRRREEATAHNEQASLQNAAARASQMQQAEATRQQMEQENQRRQAQAEVDRQKRWLDQKAREEQQAAERRAAVARADQLRNQMEDRRREEEERRRAYRR